MMTKKYTIGILLIFLGVAGMNTWGQSIIEYLAECDMKYGSDADLINGEKYFYPYSQVDGHPFLSFEAQETDLRIREKDFEGQLIKYDIFNQLLVLEFKDLYGSTSSLVLRNEWVESFHLDHQLFINLEGPGGELGFHQVVHQGSISCYYAWSKDYQLNQNSGAQSYYFTDPIKKSFLLVGGEYYPFKNNRTFLKSFSKDQRKAIKLFMNQSKIKVNKSPESQMRHLLEYCNSLPYEAA